MEIDDIEKIWIESDECQNIDIFDDNTDVIVKFKNSQKYIASFFSYNNIGSLIEKNRKSGENLNGKYIWSSDMILIENCSRKCIQEVVYELIRNKSFETIFRKIKKT